VHGKPHRVNIGTYGTMMLDDTRGPQGTRGYPLRDNYRFIIPIL
jgi:hypothetical protein